MAVERLQLQEAPEGYESGQQLKVSEMFKEGDLIDVAGTTIGKGFQGASLISNVTVNSIFRLQTRAHAAAAAACRMTCHGGPGTHASATL